MTSSNLIPPEIQDKTLNECCGAMNCSVSITPHVCRYASMPERRRSRVLEISRRSCWGMSLDYHTTLFMKRGNVVCTTRSQIYGQAHHNLALLFLKHVFQAYVKRGTACCVLLYREKEVVKVDIE